MRIISIVGYIIVGAILTTSFAYARGYDFTSDVDNLATVESARRILEENGGLFIGSERITEIFRVADLQSLSRRLPFTERAIFDCLERYGSCVLFPTVPRVGYRGLSTNIRSLSRAPEARQQLRLQNSRAAPWFKDESFHRQSLRAGWHLVALNIQGKGIPLNRQYLYHDRVAPANLYIWMLLLLPSDALIGESFYTADHVHSGRNAVYLDKLRPGEVRVYFTLADIGHQGIGVLPEIAPSKRRKHRP